ncbi:PAS domain-containing protein [Salinimicrobium oceani]|uniref:histidine kinase n=1 Tax=Salinimicrobium oceani TaxID=2722702 RepID=A0ABX1D3I5_9FLAO|nr:PAS domain-containing protein [Salinimicrobium oceani]NJW53758.1 PAS domain-containing protein [Salinimicrobium oceani]
MKQKKNSLPDHFSESDSCNDVQFKSSNQGVCILDRDLKITYWCANMANLTEISGEEMLTRELFKERYEHLFSLKKVFSQALSERTSFTVDHWNPERERWFRISIFPIEEQLFVTLRDVTPEKNRVTELTALKNLQKHILNSTSDLIWAIDKDYKLLLANEAYHQMMLNRTGEAICIGESVLQQRGEKDQRGARLQEWKRWYDLAFEGAHTKATIAVNETEVDYLYDVTFEPVISEKGGKHTIGVACFARDVSERARHLESIERQNSQLREIAWLQSHKMRAPLSNILGLTDLIMSSEKTEEKEEYVNHLQHSAVELDKIIAEIVQKISSQ